MTDITWPRGRYRLLTKAYLPTEPGGSPEMLEEETVITHDGMPGIYMEPLDAPAREAVDMANTIKRAREDYRRRTGAAAQRSMEAAFDEAAMPTHAELLEMATNPEPPKRRPGRPPANKED
jgi:hypothetical protein